MVRIAAVVGVLDEADLIERCIRHLAAIGVARILVHDRGSTDGSVALATSLSSLVPLDIHRSAAEEPLDPSVWSPVQLDWGRQVGADWLLLVDADEFWFSASGSLERELESAGADVVVVRRFNVVLSPAGPHLPEGSGPDVLDQLDLFVEPRVVTNDADALDPTLRWIRGVPMPKIAVRPDRVGELTPGSHGAVLIDGAPAGTALANSLLIAHAPFTNVERFEQKASNIRKTIRLHPEFFADLRAWHWRRWASLSGADLRAEFESQVVDERDLADLRASGSVQTAAELFRAWAA